jgi:hypothetical protein
MTAFVITTRNSAFLVVVGWVELVTAPVPSFVQSTLRLQDACKVEATRTEPAIALAWPAGGCPSGLEDRM